MNIFYIQVVQDQVEMAVIKGTNQNQKHGYILFLGYFKIGMCKITAMLMLKNHLILPQLTCIRFTHQVFHTILLSAMHHVHRYFLNTLQTWNLTGDKCGSA